MRSDELVEMAVSVPNAYPAAPLGLSVRCAGAGAGVSRACMDGLNDELRAMSAGDAEVRCGGVWGGALAGRNRGRRAAVCQPWPCEQRQAQHGMVAWIGTLWCK